MLSEKNSIKPLDELRIERLKRRLTQKEMCIILDIKSEASYSLKENGKREFSKKEMLTIKRDWALSDERFFVIFFT